MPGRKVTMELVHRSLAHYRVLGHLGKGGMGEVFLAEDQRLQRRVALKILSPELTREPRHLERFRREARAIAALNHPNVITIHAVEEAEGLCFLVLEVVEGDTLARILASTGPLPLERVLAIALPLTEALEAAHGQGIVHRDLKPRNIMVTREGRVKVLDFGIARLARLEEEPEDGSSNTGLTQTGAFVGTAAYMSPEQIQEQPVDGRSDLFSLGIILHEMATGQRPFRGKGKLSTLASILYDTPPPPSSLAPGLPGRFDEIVSLCLAKEPILRFRGAAELRKDLLDLVSSGETSLGSTVSGYPQKRRKNEEESDSSVSRGGTNPRLPVRPRYFGRELEVCELAETLCTDPPPPTPVLGPAGAGKSTITLAALHDRRVAERFGKRRWFVRCDGATDRDGLAGAISRVVCPEALPPLEPRIFAKLEGAPAVLALDNLETPWERDTAAVEELLTEIAAIPGLALVVALRGEQRPFGPSWREAIHAGPLDPESARSAFLAVAGERYQDDPDLDPLLLALDGLALAVVLLASQAEGEPDLSMLRLRWQERRTALLRRAGARGPQQSLEISLGLSIDSPRMNGESRRLLSILGLLPDGVARDDLEALLPGQGAEAASVLRKVGLVFDQGSRLRMLAPVREHVRQSQPPADEDFERTVDHYLALARLGEKVGREGGAEAVQRLRPETGNLEPMILAGIERTDPKPALRSALAYAEVIQSTGQGGAALITKASQRASQAGEAELEADCFRKQGDIDLFRGRYEQARASHDQARAIYEQAGLRKGEAACLARLGEIHLQRTDPSSATRLLEEAYALSHALGDAGGEAQSLLGLGFAAVQRSDYPAGRAFLERARDLYRQIGGLRGEANCLQQLGQVSFDLDFFEQARAEYDAALPLFRRVGSFLGEANSLRNLGHIALRQGDARAARAYADKALLLSRRVGSILGEANCLFVLGEAACALGEHERAETLLQQARVRYQRIGQGVGAGNCMESLGVNAAAQADTWKARHCFEEALRTFEDVPQPISVGRVHLKLAELSSPGSPERLGHLERARETWEKAGLLDQMRSALDAVASE